MDNDSLGWLLKLFLGPTIAFLLCVVVVVISRKPEYSFLDIATMLGAMVTGSYVMYRTVVLIIASLPEDRSHSEDED